ncbi:MAG: hypothetical protein NTZ50_16400, partial [Chloroflexi bacterium]|nr:hypothetical protein [Chloroflexota bacterium]
YSEDDQLPHALLAVLCYLQLHGKGERRGTQSAAEYLRKNVLPMLKDRDADGRTSQLRDAIHNTLRT